MPLRITERVARASVGLALQDGRCIEPSIGEARKDEGRGTLGVGATVAAVRTQPNNVDACSAPARSVVCEQ
jgi:hypothetical protein